MCSRRNSEPTSLNTIVCLPSRSIGLLLFLIIRISTRQNRHRDLMLSLRSTTCSYWVLVLGRWSPAFFFIRFKVAVSRYSVIFCAFFARVKNGYCSRKCCGDQLGQPREQLHRPNWVEQMSFSSSNCCFPRPQGLWPPLFFPTQNGCQKSQIIVTLPL